jgi:peptide-methionine (S)-S-oxide reductase
MFKLKISNNMFQLILIGIYSTAMFWGCDNKSNASVEIPKIKGEIAVKEIQKKSVKMQKDTSKKEGLEIATLGGGCFWCIEAVFEDLKGVEKSVSGYSGGKTLNPTYREVCYGNTGHAEVINVYFDPQIISYEDILRVFFHVHDPTTLNRQGNDIGTQYRSVIYYHNEAQQESAKKIIEEIEKSNLWDSKIVTEVSTFARFYLAEDYHQEYYKLNGHEPYCQYVISPKMAKFRKEFKDKLKNGQ